MRITGSTIIKLSSLPLLTLVITGVVLVHYKPDATANKYRAAVKSESRTLAKTFQATAKTSENRIFLTPDTPPSEAIQICNEIKTNVAATQQAIDTFSRNSQSLKKISYPKLSDSYTRATVAEMQAKDAAEQSTEVLNKYRELLDYLIAINTARATYEAAIHYVNSYPDLYALTSQLGQVNAYTHDLQAAVTNLGAAKPPLELTATKNDLIAIMNQATEGFTTMTYGLQNRNDTYIYSGTNIIDASTAKYDNHDTNAFFEATAALNVLKDVDNLPDKLDSFSEL